MKKNINSVWNKKNILVINIIIFITLVFPLFSFAQYIDQLQPAGVAPAYVPGEVIVKFKDSSLDISKLKNFNRMPAYMAEDQVLSAVASSLSEEENIKLEDTSSLGKLGLFKTIDNQSVENLIEILKQNPNVEYAEPNYYRLPATINTNDTYKDNLWGLDNIGQLLNGTTGISDADIDASEAWAINEGTNASIIAAVVDVGIAYNHPDLINNMWDGTNCVDENGVYLGGCVHGYDFSNNTKTPLANGNAHATHIAGTIGAQKNNGMGVIGVAPNVKIMALNTDYNIYYIAKAIDFANKNGAKVINASYVSPYSSLVEFYAIKRFRDSGGLFVAAAANYAKNNDTYPIYPASYNLDNIISVAATGQSDTLASFSDWGLTSVDVAAPGVNIYSTYCSSNCTSQSYGYMNGTSMATPHVVGLASLLWGTNPNLTNIAIKNIILSTGDSIASLSTKILTGKRINANNAEISLSNFSAYIPKGGYSIDNIIPASQINYSSGTGQITINFKVKDSYPGLTEQLTNFSYSTDGGIIWQSPIGGDNSGAFSDNWAGNNYISKADYSGNSNNFIFDSKYSESIGINNVISNNTKIRFKVTDGINISDYVVSEAFSVNNFTHNLNITQPLNSVTIDANNYNIIGSTNAGSLVQIYRNIDIVGSVQLGPEDTDFNISVILNQNLVNNFTIKVTEPIYNLEKTLVIPSINEVSDTSIIISLLNIESLTTPPFIINTTTPTITINGELNMLCRYDTVDASYSTMPPANTCTTNGTEASCTLPNQGADGIKNIYISCIDQELNETIPSSNVDVEFITDTIAPLISLLNIESLTTPPFIINTTTPTITINGELNMLCRYDTVDASYSTMPPANTCTTNGTEASCTLPNQGADGIKNIYISCIDQAGNKNIDTDNVDVVFTLDTNTDFIAPLISLLNIESLTTPPFIINTTTPTITINGELNMLCRYDTVDASYSTMPPANTCTTNGTEASCTLPNQGADGVKNVYVSCMDEEENETFSQNNLYLEFILDTMPLVINFYSLDNITSSPFRLKNRTPVITLSGESNMLCRFDTVDTSYSNMPPTNTCTTNGTEASCTLPNQGEDGVKNVYVSCMDEARNQNTSLDNINITFTLFTPSSGGGGGGGGGTPVIPPVEITQLEIIPAVENKNNCKIGDIFDSTTGLKCPTSNEIPQGCTTYTLFSPLNGIKCPIITTTTTPITTNTILTRTLKLGMQGNDVKELQIYLNTHAYPIALYNLGSQGKETTSFGSLTKKAVIKFQIANSLVGDGVVGKMTREKMK